MTTCKHLEEIKSLYLLGNKGYFNNNDITFIEHFIVYKILSHALGRLHLTTALRGSYYSPHLMEEETEAQRVPVTCPRSESY